MNVPSWFPIGELYIESDQLELCNRICLFGVRTREHCSRRNPEPEEHARWNGMIDASFLSVDCVLLCQLADVRQTFCRVSVDMDRYN